MTWEDANFILELIARLAFTSFAISNIFYMIAVIREGERDLLIFPKAVVIAFALMLWFG